MGHHGHLPELTDETNDSGIAHSMATLPRRKSVLLSPTPTPHVMKVPVDVEPITEMEDQIREITFLSDTAQSSLSSEPDWTRRRGSEDSLGLRRTSLDDVGSLMPPSRRASRQIPIHEEEPTDSKFLFTTPDNVVSEDGKILASNH